MIHLHKNLLSKIAIERGIASKDDVHLNTFPGDLCSRRCQHGDEQEQVGSGMDERCGLQAVGLQHQNPAGDADAYRSLK